LGDTAMRQKVDLAATLADSPRAGQVLEATARLVRLRRSHPALRDGNSAQVPLANTNTVRRCRLTQ
jgi:hypothetical protein